MGGGASKPSDDANAKSSAQNANGNGTSSNPATARSNATKTAASGGAAFDNVAQVGGLSCTVTDAVSNARVPFLSSVTASPKGNRKGKRANKNAAAAAAADESSTSTAAEDLVYFGDAAINKDRDPSQELEPKAGTAAQLAASQAADRGDWRAAMSVLYQAARTPPGCAPVLVGGAVVGGAPLGDSVTSMALMGVGIVTPQSAPLTGSNTPQADLNLAGGNTNKQQLQQQQHAAAVKYTPHLKAAVFTSKVRYGAPINYSIRTVGGQQAAVRAIASSADGNLFASVYAGGRSAQYFDGTTGALIMEIRAHLDPIVAIAHSKDGKFLLTSSNDGNVCLWDLNNGKKLREIPVTSQANAVAISDDSELIATSSTEDFVNLWEAKNGEALTMFQRHAGAVYCVDFARRNNIVASGSQNGEVFVWGGQAGDVRLHVETGARSAVMHVSFSADGTRLVTADRDVLQVWDLFTGGLVCSRNGSGDVVLGEEGKSLHQPSFAAAPKELPRITCVTFAACNNIVCGLTSRRVLVIEPNTATEMLSLDLRALVTCVSTNWGGDVVFIGDYLGNHYRLQLQYLHRDVVDFGLNTKPPSKDKGKADRD